MIGQTFRSYKIESIIGEGGMGTVYQAVNLNLNQRVAVKILHTNLIRQPSLVDRFKREALIQARLTHPNIVTVYDFFQESDICGIVMEYIEGRTFDQILAQNNGPLPPQEVIQLFLPLLNALNFAHSNQVIHRDIKPSNLILQSLSGVRVPKIMDFGIARAMDESKRLTATGTKMGTLWYMSPEQCEGATNIGHQSDIFSMAVAMYEMLSARVPFDFDSDYQLMKAIINDPTPPIRQINPAVPQILEAVLGTAMQKDPARRFASAGVFAKALTGSAGQAPQPQPQPQRQPQPQPQPQPRPLPRPPVVPKTGKSNTPLILGIAALAVVLILGMVWLVGSGKSTAEKQTASTNEAAPLQPTVKKTVATQATTPMPTPVSTPMPSYSYNPGAAKSEASQGLSCFKNNNYSCALDHFKKAVQYDPSSGQNLDNVAFTYMKMGNWNECVNWAIQAADKADGNKLRGSSRRNVAKCYANMGNTSQACYYYKQSLLVRSNSTTKKECNRLCSDCP